MLQAAGFDVQGQSFTSWEILQKALLHHGGERIINLLVGPGYHGAGSDWASTYLSPADSFVALTASTCEGSESKHCVLTSRPLSGKAPFSTTCSVAMPSTKASALWQCGGRSRA